MSKLPELPEPAGVIVVGTQALRAFTADQMHAHAEAIVRMCAEVVGDLVDMQEEARADAASRDARGTETELNRLQHWSTVSTYNAGIRRSVSRILALLEKQP